MNDRKRELGKVIGRGAVENPPNRFERTHTEDDFEHFEGDAELAEDRRIATEFLRDETQSIIATNDSPDIPFRRSINPYRGCEHGCAYCYARPYHEYLGMNAGLDFESKILVKFDAAARLRDELNKPGWQPEEIAISGVTDCYQPAERKLKITRSILEVLLEARHPCGIITKNALVVRDLDVIAELAARSLIHVNVSITSLDQELTRVMEPRTSSPAARLKAVRQLREAGVPVRVMVAPIIPGLNDHQMPKVLQAAAEAGAQGAGFTLLRLPHAVLPVFTTWLKEHLPLAEERVLSRIRETRGGELNDARFGSRLKGEGEYAEQIKKTFNVFKKKFGLDQLLPPLDAAQFRPPRSSSGQKTLF